MNFIKSIFLILACSFSYTISSQCFISKNDAEKEIELLGAPYNIVGKWSVGVRGTLFYNNSILLSDFTDYPVDWYVLPSENGYKFCIDEEMKDLGVVKGMLVLDPGIENQFFYYGLDESGEERISIARHVSKDILIFHYKASDEYVKKNYADKVKGDKLDEVHLLWEYVLTRRSI